MPGAIGDPLVRLGHRVTALRLEEKEVAVLVDRLAAKAEVPIDHTDRAVEEQVAQAGFFSHLAPCGLRGRLAHLEMALGKAPVAIGVADQQKARLTLGVASEDDAARGRFPLRPALLA